MKLLKRIVVLSLLVVACLTGCSPSEADKAQATSSKASRVAERNRASGCIETFDPDMDYFPAKAQLKHATNFSIEYHRSYKVVSVHRTSEGGTSDRYVLYQCGAPKPSIEGGVVTLVPVPIVSLFAGSTTNIAFLRELDRLAVLTGLSETKYVVDDDVLTMIREKKVVEWQHAGLTNAEFIVAQAPSVVMPSGNTDPGFAPLRVAGIPLVANMEWLETTALGRAEWLKFMAAFLNEEARAEERYDAMVSRYTAVAERTKDIPEGKRIKVMTGGAFRGAYTAAGGRSYVAGLIEDAGGTYVWADNQDTSSVTVDSEVALARAATADFWINGGEWKSLKEMLADDPRYTGFKAYRTGQVWLYDKTARPTGGNDYWSRGVTQPERILADLIKIFYPDRARDYEFEWYRQVPAE